jgi:hypothetical protein
LRQQNGFVVGTCVLKGDLWGKYLCGSIDLGFENGGNKIVTPLYGRKRSCEVKARRIQDILSFT